MPEFAVRYRAELDANEVAVTHLTGLISAHEVVTVLYGAHDVDVNHAAVLQGYLHDRFGTDIAD
jgi:uncharacterized protein YeaO (DUF488 family)